MKLWKHQYLLTTAKLLGRQKAARKAPCNSRIKYLRKTAGFCVLGCETNELIIDELKIRPTAAAAAATTAKTTTTHNKLAAEYK
jgi:hypothetical protein